MNTETLFSFLTIGFNLCFSIYLMLRYFFENCNKYFIYLAFLSIFFNVFIFIHVLKLSDEFHYLKIVKNIALNSVVILFYFFMYSFFGEEKTKFVKYVLIIGISFIVLSSVIEILLPINQFFDKLNNVCSDLFVYFDLSVLFILLFHLHKRRESYLKYIFFGLSFVILCALAIHFGNSLFGIFAIISHVSILELEVSIGFCFIFLSILSLEKQKEMENRLLIETIENKDIQIKRIEKNSTIDLIQYKKRSISVQNISFIKSDAHYVDIHFQDGTKEMVRGKISEILNLLPANFKHTHKSYIINTNCIKEKRKDAILLKNNLEIPLSRTYKSNF